MSHWLHGLLATKRERIFYMFLQMLVCFRYCDRLDDVPLSIRLSFRMGLTLSCFLSSRYTSHWSMRWSIARVVLHRLQSGWFPFVSTYFCVIFVYLAIILQLGYVFLEWVVLYSCICHSLWLAVVALLRFSTRCSNGVWFFAWWASRKSSGRLVLWQEIVEFAASLAVLSVLSFTLIPEWNGTHITVIELWFFIDSM